MDEKIRTTQQTRGEHHLGEGTSTPKVPAVQYATDTPSLAGVTEPVKGEIIKMEFPFSTSQQRADEHSTPEVEK